jgi:hypothetical protein
LFDAVGTRSALQNELDSHTMQINQLQNDTVVQKQTNESIYKRIDEVEFNGAESRRAM